MATVRTFVADSLKLIGALASGETPTADEANDAFAALNRMLSNWSTERLIVYNRTIETFPFVASQQSYTMGPSGNFNTVRPIAIEKAQLSIPGSQPADYTLEQFTVDEWAKITSKSVTSSLPQVFYMENTMPTATLKFWPVPTTANNVVLYSFKALTAFATLDDTISLPPGYEEAVLYNLSIRLAPFYGKPVSQEVALIASDAKANIKRANMQPQIMSMDSAVIGRAKGFNFYTGE